MEDSLIAKAEVLLNATVEQVWEASTNPEMIEQYFFGTKVKSDWQEGSPITFSGEWEGQPYEDKGTILEIRPPEILKFSYWSSFSGLEDAPENYKTVTYMLIPKGEKTLLNITQSGAETEEEKKKSEQNWKTVLDNMKVMLEKDLSMPEAEVTEGMA